MVSCGLMAIALAGCSASPPRKLDDACAIFYEKDDWYEEAREAQKRWGVPISLQLAFIRQESSFRSDARPPRRWYLGFIPGPRPSRAFGYAQALDSTWAEYQRETGKRWADRDDFGDAVDFIGWYNARSSRACGIGRTDAYRLYLAYHEGPTGYRRGSHRKKGWLLTTAQKVSARAARYDSQLRTCEKKLQDQDGFWFF